MTANEIFELRRQKRQEEAYDAARQLYACDKGPIASSAMFWTAIDVLKLRVAEGRLYEARMIFLALRRLLPNVPDKEGLVGKAFKKSNDILVHAERPENASHLEMGKWGEQLAVAYLREKGYVILERDWRSGHRDIDIIAIDNDVVVFVEVKTRRNDNFGHPILSVDHNKRHNLRKAIMHYLNYHNITQQFRFDVITIVGTLECANPTINHFQDLDINGIVRR